MLTNLYIVRDVNNIISEGAEIQLMFLINILMACVFLCVSRNKGKIDLLNIFQEDSIKNDVCW